MTMTATNSVVSFRVMLNRFVDYIQIQRKNLNLPKCNIITDVMGKALRIGAGLGGVAALSVVLAHRITIVYRISSVTTLAFYTATVTLASSLAIGILLGIIIVSCRQPPAGSIASEASQQNQIN
ncbi:MAG: hypothetical protein H0X51_04750 [Parachlamydiaceae bacterium]|nr:hypothetical protein [Parachlamydiaceae bacterium]